VARSETARPSNGTVLALGFALVAVLFGAALWYAQVHAFYERVEGLAAVSVAGVAVPVTGYEGLDGASSPLKLRGCFRLDPAALPAAPAAVKPTPLVAPGWFDCFDAAALDAVLRAGEARALVAAAGEPAGFDRIIAVFPDGRAYQWRQIAEGAGG
jgi:hypothetical protein